MKVCSNKKCIHKGKPQPRSNFWKIYKTTVIDSMDNIQCWCIDCKSAYRKANPKKNTEYYNRWARNNPGRAKEKWDNWVKNNLERRREIARNSARRCRAKKALKEQNAKKNNT